MRNGTYYTIKSDHVAPRHRRSVFSPLIPTRAGPHMSGVVGLYLPLLHTISSHTPRGAWITLKHSPRPISRRAVCAAPPFERPKKRCRRCDDTSRGRRSSSSQPLPRFKVPQNRSLRPRATVHGGPPWSISCPPSSHDAWSVGGGPRRVRRTISTQVPLVQCSGTCTSPSPEHLVAHVSGRMVHSQK